MSWIPFFQTFIEDLHAMRHRTSNPDPERVFSGLSLWQFQGSIYSGWSGHQHLACQAAKLLFSPHKDGGRLFNAMLGQVSLTKSQCTWVSVVWNDTSTLICSQLCGKKNRISKLLLKVIYVCSAVNPQYNRLIREKLSLSMLKVIQSARHYKYYVV